MEFKNRFLKIVTKSGVSFAAISFGCLLPYMSLAASSNGCDDLDKNDSINPEIALCSTHVYNIKAVTNPDSNTAKSQLTKDVVALKSTIIMQQMYKQYEYLEATISRLKTQLRREILTSKLETAGASSSSSSSSGSTSSYTDRNVYLAGTSNCNNESTISGVFTCLRNNYNLIYNMSNSGTNLTIELRKQLANDCGVVSQNASVAGLDANSLKSVSVGSSAVDCTIYTNIKGRNEFQKCMEAMNVQIRNATTYLTQQQQKNQQSRS